MFTSDSAHGAHDPAQQLPAAASMQPEPPRDEPPSDPPSKPSETPRIIQAEELFAGQREVWIQFGDQRYRLRITAAEKLILTK